MKSLGRHLLIEFYDCDQRIIGNVQQVENIMVLAAKATKANIVDVVFHTFNPQGVSGVIVIAESHLAIHTWPEFNFASVDIYTCGEVINPWKALTILKRSFKAKNMNVLEIKRGILNIPSRRLKHKP